MIKSLKYSSFKNNILLKLIESEIPHICLVLEGIKPIKQRLREEMKKDSKTINNG